jgi:hypothetical protein
MSKSKRPAKPSAGTQPGAPAKPKPHPQEELFHLLAGKQGRAIRCQDGDLPTDTGKVMEGLVEALVADAAHREHLRKALLRLAQDPERGWLLMYYLIDLLMFVQPTFGVQVLDADLLAQFGKALAANRAALSADTSYGGDMYPDGLWGDVKRLDAIITRNYGLKVLPESV